MVPIHYIPSVICVKCGNKSVENLRRVHDAKTRQRYLVAECHGEKARIEFVTALGAEVKAFGR